MLIIFSIILISFGIVMLTIAYIPYVREKRKFKALCKRAINLKSNL